MLYYRKYLHVELIGSRVCSFCSRTAAIITAFWKCVEIARLPSTRSRFYSYRSISEITRKDTWRVFQMQTKLGKSARGSGRGKRRKKVISQCVTRIQANAQGTQYAEWIMPPQSQISLYCPNSAAEAAGISSSELYSVSFRAPACPRIFTRMLYPRIFTYVHVHIRVARPPNHG